MQFNFITKFIGLVVIGTMLLSACNGSGNGKDKQLPTNADSAYQALIKAHDLSMESYMRVEDELKKINRKIDSLQGLPEELRSLNEHWEEHLSDSYSALKAAFDKMDYWMGVTSFDTLKNDQVQRLKYFTERKSALDTVSIELNKALHLADSLLMKK
jgi:conjugal transfer/entry exclusion protein